MQGEADKVKAAFSAMVDAIPSYIKLEYWRMEERKRAIRHARSKAD
jgi:hypothetical protein